MKILYVTSGNNMDYMNDLLFHGLYSLYGAEVIDSQPLWYLYEEYLPFHKEYLQIHKSKRLYGRGFSISKSIQKDEVDRTDIPNKIKMKYYDYVFYGQVNRCIDFLDLVLEYYPLNKVVFIDGEDEKINYSELFSERFIYFKREIGDLRNNMYPISFAFIKDRIVKDISSIKKTQKFGSVIPGNKKTYKFKREKSYYKDYQKSYFGKTCKKAGWDCMRHYEILANYCLPHFVDLVDCPVNIMTNYPKKLGLEANKLAESKSFNHSHYYELLNETFNYFNTHMTTDSLAKYVMNILCKLQ